VEGTIEAARELGADVAVLATGAAQGAVEAGDRIGAAAGRTVRAAVSGTISGTKVVAGKPHEPARPTTERPGRKKKGRAAR
jgi:hypothetical protein